MPVLITKILIVGGFGVGKTTLVGAISEIRPLRTGETISERSIGVGDLSGADRKTTTTVAMDFGRITFTGRLLLYLFGAPGQERFWFMWDDLAYGAIGAVVLAGTRRLEDSFASVCATPGSGSVEQVLITLVEHVLKKQAPDGISGSPAW